MRSMTGFGSATRESRYGRLTAEARSVNNRFLEANMRLGSAFLHLESRIRNELKNDLKRGKVDLTLRYEPAEEMAPVPRLNVAMLRGLIRQAEEANLATPGSLAVEQLFTVPGALSNASDNSVEEQLEAEIFAVIKEAVAALVADRDREGKAIAEVLLAARDRMEERRAAIDAGREEVVAKYRERLAQRMEDLLGPKAASLDPGRLEQEVVIFADKADLSEEVHRLSAHLEALGDLVSKEDEAVGRSLEFLTQEILREINTIGSKCRDLELSRHVLELKKEVESLREVIANVE